MGFQNHYILHIVANLSRMLHGIRGTQYILKEAVAFQEKKSKDFKLEEKNKFLKLKWLFDSSFLYLNPPENEPVVKLKLQSYWV